MSTTEYVKAFVQIQALAECQLTALFYSCSPTIQMTMATMSSSSSSLGANSLVSKMSYQASYMFDFTFRWNFPHEPSLAKQSKRIWTGRVSSVGMLDCLPWEIMSNILGKLDSQSLAFFASVSVQSNMLARSYEPFQELAQHSRMLGALHRMDLVRRYSVAQLNAVLRTENCVSCGEYGPFLFLPTCERCCWDCRRSNPLLRAISPKQAKKYFDLSMQHLQQLPFFYGQLGTYGPSAGPPARRGRLVTVQAAKALGLAVHGSAEKLAQATAKRCKSSARHSLQSRYLQTEPSVFQGQDPPFLSIEGDGPLDRFFHMVSLPFPYLSRSGKMETGSWCRGCDLILSWYTPRLLPPDVLADLVPSNSEPRRVLLGLVSRARSKESQFKHIKRCYGARQILPELATEDG